MTGSGKTEIYLRVIEEVLKRGKNAFYLVPEIALTPQTVARVRAQFGETVAVFHSGLGQGERFDEWWRVKARRGAGGGWRPLRFVCAAGQPGSDYLGRGT